MRFDLHVHTTYSKHWFWGHDALGSPDAVVKIAIRKGLSGVAITDHNSTKGSLIAKRFARRYDKNFIVITGSEISTRSGHIVALGIEEDIKPGLSVEETIDIIRSSGGLAIAAHPFSKFIFRKCVGYEAIKADAIEILNACSCTELQNKKARELAEKFALPGVACTDSHSLKTIGLAGIICKYDPIKAIKRNDFKIFGRVAPKSAFLYVCGGKICRFFSQKRKQPRYGIKTSISN